jgi:hypothetical protein
LLHKWNASPATITPTIFKQFLRRDISTLEYGKVDARDRMTASNVNPSGFPKMQMRDSARYRISPFSIPALNLSTRFSAFESDMRHKPPLPAAG